jgi:hypothetical protein
VLKSATGYLKSLWFAWMLMGCSAQGIGAIEQNLEPCAINPDADYSVTIADDAQPTQPGIQYELARTGTLRELFACSQPTTETCDGAVYIVQCDARSFVFSVVGPAEWDPTVIVVELDADIRNQSCSTRYPDQCVERDWDPTLTLRAAQ